MLADSFGRRVDYLRLSVTDRCNLRCSYCLPIVYGKFQPSENLLSDAEIVSLVKCFAREGFRKIRITGGEPLVRPKLPQLIERIASVPGIQDISMTTNGMFLRRYAQDLVNAGLKRVNISLDTLNEKKFKEVTGYGDLATVLDSIEAALDAGLTPVKINCVVARGVNGGEIPAFAAMTEKRPLHVRFIELMPMGETGFFNSDRHMPLAEIMKQVGPLEEGLVADERPVGHGPARYYRRPGAAGTLGFISALSCGFCGDCNRVRLSAVGTLVPCLDGEDGQDLRGPLRSGADAGELQALIRKTVWGKPEGHRMVERAEGQSENPRFMCSIGG